MWCISFLHVWSHSCNIVSMYYNYEYQFVCLNLCHCYVLKRFLELTITSGLCPHVCGYGRAHLASPASLLVVLLLVVLLEVEGHRAPRPDGPRAQRPDGPRAPRPDGPLQGPQSREQGPDVRPAASHGLPAPHGHVLAVGQVAGAQSGSPLPQLEKKMTFQ